MSTFTITQDKENINLYVYPNSDLSGCTDWTPIGDTPNYKCIDEARIVPDDDATYNYWDGVALGVDVYTLPNDTVINGAINYVQIYARSKSNIYAQHEDGIFKILCSPTSECSILYKSSDMDLTTKYKTYSQVLTENPHTSAAWTEANVRDLSIGVEASSPEVNDAPLQKIFRPSSAGYIFEWRQFVTSPAAANNYTFVDEVNLDTSSDDILYAWRPNIGIDYATDSYEISGTVDTGIIDDVVLFYVGKCGRQDMWSRCFLRLNATNYYESNFLMSASWALYGRSWSTNPDTSIAWAWGDLAALEVGFNAEYRGNDAGNPYLAQMYLVVNYHKTFSPQIHTTQCYARVNYTPPLDTCTLNKPEHISTNHSDNIKMLNFWDGTREVYGLERGKKGMVLTGSEYQSDTCNKVCPCERIACMRAMGKDGSTISIAGLSFGLYNGDYKIRSFGWKHISEKPEYYEWILELEDAT